MKKKYSRRLEASAPAYLPIKKLIVANRGTGFLLGLIVSMGLVLTAFNWTTVRYTSPTDLPVMELDPIEDDIIPITMHSELPPPPPPPPAGKLPPVPVENITKAIDVKPALDPSPVETDPLAKIKLPEFPKETVDNDDDIPKISVEEWPAFPGCEHILDQRERKACTDAKIQRALMEGSYPQMAAERNAQGTVYLTFVVEKDGSVDRIEVLKGVYGAKELDKEAVRRLKSLPKFAPGKQRGRNVPVRHNINIKFELK